MIKYKIWIIWLGGEVQGNIKYNLNKKSSQKLKSFKTLKCLKNKPWVKIAHESWFMGHKLSLEILSEILSELHSEL